MLTSAGTAAGIDACLYLLRKQLGAAEANRVARGLVVPPHTLDSLARDAKMSRRTFTCHFKALTGTSVQAWLLAERLALAQRLLERTDQPIERVSDLAGFGSVVSLRPHVRRAFSESPTTWRRNLGGPLTPA